LKRGLVIGKFLPLHVGHCALINFAASQCDELIVSMSFTDSDPIPWTLREEWLKTTFESSHKIIIAVLEDNFDNESLPLQERTKIWAEKMRAVYPKIDIIFSSEEYGTPFARNLEAEHRLFDLKREQFPVSASLIRKKPFQLWSFIPRTVRPFFVKKICFYGPESVGKSTMAEKMAFRYQTVFVPEVAREMLTKNEFTEQDIVDIGTAHYQRVLDQLSRANKFLFCDTDAITTQIYSKHYLNVIPDQRDELEEKIQYDHYFLFDIDVPWVSDGLRDLPNRRAEMFQLFKNALDDRKISYSLVKGNWEQRENIVTQWIDRYLT
jgi:HTH-type transcriptional regulator, transcriptional repressor of NAD biosynthesis genes